MGVEFFNYCKYLPKSVQDSNKLWNDVSLHSKLSLINLTNYMLFEWPIIITSYNGHSNMVTIHDHISWSGVIMIWSHIMIIIFIVVIWVKLYFVAYLYKFSVL